MTVRITQHIKGFQVVDERLRPSAEAEAGKPPEQLDEHLERPEMLIGVTYKIKSPLFEHALYVTINDILLNAGTRFEQRRPFEIFINSKGMEHFQWIVALTRIMSAVFRKGGDCTFLVEELKAVFDPRGGQWVGGRYVPSLLAAIGDVIERHMMDIGFIPDPKAAREPIEARDERKVVNLGGDTRLRHCPKCNQPSLLRSEGCDTCTSCGYSKCG